MSVVVGYGPEGRGHGSLALGRQLSESSGLPLVVCCVVPDRWSTVGPGRQVDRDYQERLLGLADHTLAEARELLGKTTEEPTFQVVTARSAPAGLLDTVAEQEGRILVLGSSSDGPWGHIAIGSVTDRLLHSSPVALALAPRGYRATDQVSRVTVAVDGTESSQDVLDRAAAVADEVGARLRIVTFAVRGRTMYPPEAGLHAEDQVVAAWREQAERIVEQALERLEPTLEREPQLHVAEARSWAEALDEPGWSAGDVLVVGSSQNQPLLSRVFLGSTAARIIRHAPVPVVVVP